MLLSTQSLDASVHEICLVDSDWYGLLGGGNGSGSGVQLLDEYLSGDIPSTGMFLSTWVVGINHLKRNLEHYWDWIRRHPEFDIKIIVLGPDRIDKAELRPLPEEYIHLILPENVQKETLTDVLENAFFNLRLRNEKLQLQSRLALSSQELRRLTKVAQSLSTERDFDVLIDQILTQAREMVSADGGSIYVVEREKSGQRTAHLRFKKSALNLATDEFLLPIDSNSIAGYVAMQGKILIIDDVYALSGNEEYRFNYEFDRAHNYYTKSMMVIPMKNHRSQVIGVIQLINKKRHYGQQLTAEDMKGDAVIAFTEKDQELAMALAGQAAVAIENNLLIQDIENLFEGFVTASVTAIEQRDPTTSGHSFRVAEFCVGLAKAVDRLSSGNFAHNHFSADQIREIRYAALLHDFGKVGVREKVLVKAKKLYPNERELIEWRFRYIRLAVEKHYADKKLRYLKNNDRASYSEYEELMNREMQERLNEVDDMMRVIVESDEPTVVEAGNFEKLEQIARKKIRLPGGIMLPFLHENELISLSIRRGNLNQQERLEIESHVSHTYRFLIQIPWTGDLARVPDIAHGHHEKLDGSGYPLGLAGDEISLQTRMMTIADIYDALTAPDRPYKKSLPAENALDILKLEAKEQRLDERLLNVFIESEVFRVTESPWT
ncbi:MAG: GAF domain-containing protein [Leptospiraceae bacterium]|nr:GAF domain-containing protein [Leptospiraceae bacterium]